MKWFTKRVLLNSKEDMFGVMPNVLVGFVDKLKSEGRVHLWYTSLKSDDCKPSFRVYLQIDENDEEYIQSELNSFLQENADQIGWTGHYFSQDPSVDPSHPHLNEINVASELVLKLVKRYPCIDRIKKQDFWNLVRTEVNNCLSSMDSAHHDIFIHFVANNLALGDNMLLKNLRISKRT